MNNNRRDFLKQAAILSGSMALWGGIPPAIQKAMAINPDLGTSYLDAEHVVFLMQENRSFDHAFGSLQGVRGFNDPRAIKLANGVPVWLQQDDQLNTYKPFHLDIHNTKATWMNDIPHSWENQVDARNNGKYDQWIESKRPGSSEFSHIPLTMGFYNRQDIPFYYALADAFTICDQHFCSALTGTTTNRMYFWTGKSRDPKTGYSVVRNSEATYNREVDWKTYPERLEENGVSWKVYQNEISLDSGLSGEDESLLANFTDNNLEWFKQFNVRFSKSHYSFLQKAEKELLLEIGGLEKKHNKEPTNATGKSLAEQKEKLLFIQDALLKYSPANFEKLSEFEQNIHAKAFTINDVDPDYHTTEWMDYEKAGKNFKTKIPKGDILHEFRKAVKEDNLPTVSWLVPPQKFSDHPSAPWYGAWYVSEVMNILTENPEIWKKTIFILNYDENDGYFDHIPPFVAPHPTDNSTGKVTSGIQTHEEFVTMEEELSKPGMVEKNARESPIGLGYRVPLIIASPWTRGGWVNSEVCDLTSSLMFLEKFLKHKTGKDIIETNISSWRRSICGNLTSAFRPTNEKHVSFPEQVAQKELIKNLHQSKFKNLPDNFGPLKKTEIEAAIQKGKTAQILPRQEAGIRNSNALPYDFNLNGNLSKEQQALVITFQNSTKTFGEKTSGVPFQIYSSSKYREKDTWLPMKVWSFAVEAGKTLDYHWPLSNFENGYYQLDAYGPNGYYRGYKGNVDEANVELSTSYDVAKPKKPKLLLHIRNLEVHKILKIILEDQAYGKAKTEYSVEPGSELTIGLNTSKSYGWYDYVLLIEGSPIFERKMAGRIETGLDSKTDPQMGNVPPHTSPYLI
ncbi:phosphocholine-specific phospholipase C [Anditalea andensis]|uniref:phospholipase C n=1 Tax=Anditalea andensis TaxID=1048983 RepID=A0A074KPU9_9BACT|nr:phospholipase C, phosphocholine-specific [Anditalea andensis]KEO71981.1 phospholipase C [Anditalea andensis]